MAENPGLSTMLSARGLWDALWHDGSQTILNRGTGGSALDATSGSGSGSDSNDPLWLPWAGTHYLHLPGTAGNSVSCTAPAAATQYAAYPLGGGAPTTGAATGGAPFDFPTVGSWLHVDLLDVGDAVVASFVVNAGSQTDLTDDYSVVWAVNRATTGRKTACVTQSVWLFGTDDYMNVDSHALLNFGASDAFGVMAVIRQWSTTVNGGGIITKGASNARAVTSKRWVLRGWTTERWFGSADDGTNYCETTAANSTFTPGALSVIAMTASTTTLTPYQGGVAGATASRTAGDLTNSSPLRIGEIAGTYSDFEMIAGGVFGYEPSARQMADAATYYLGRAA